MKAALLVPAPFDTVSGGYIYDRRIVEGLRGRIAAENRRDAEGRVTGARFIIRLPVA